MKKLALLSFSLLLTVGLFAQKTFDIGSFTVKKINFSLGYETDMVNGLDYNYFVNKLPSSEKAALSTLNFAPGDLYGGICENPSLNLGLTLTHPALKNFEWHNMFSYKANRVDAVTYYNNTGWDGDYISFDNRHTEIGFESALLYKVSAANFLNLYGGLGTNLGFTTGNETCIFTSLDLTALDINFRNIDDINNMVTSEDYGYYSTCFNTGTEFNQRMFLQFGASLQFFNKIEFGVDYKYGYGYRTDVNSLTGTNLSSYNVSLRYILNDRVEEEPVFHY